MCSSVKTGPCWVKTTRITRSNKIAVLIPLLSEAQHQQEMKAGRKRKIDVEVVDVEADEQEQEQDAGGLDLRSSTVSDSASQPPSPMKKRALPVSSPLVKARNVIPYVEITTPSMKNKMSGVPRHPTALLRNKRTIGLPNCQVMSPPAALVRTKQTTGLPNHRVASLPVHDEGNLLPFKTLTSLGDHPPLAALLCPRYCHHYFLKQNLL
ncbi:hypothetical protein BT96DRAFT_937405 [Gymnopus androsaceus JB14]|uniref:Uncharacterized protein n=1 Tax=Gymnopus androsaceus JB14 TaxID=1447944 RepID=A0A6A4HSG0_9AGAR|nr:hypothetical protein BT96DRAFT_937405 [Gymnopus androsaceus JB14]